MPNEQLFENLGPDDHAKALLQSLASGAKLEPALRQQLLDALVTKVPQEDVENVASDTAKALNTVSGKVSLDSLQPRNENEAVVLRAVKASRLWKPTDERTEEEKAEGEWFYKEFDMKRPEYRRAMIDLLRDFGATLDINDVKYFLRVLNGGEYEEFGSSFSGSAVKIPKGFSEGDLLEIRRNLIQRYLGEIPESEDDPSSSRRLSYQYLIRPDVFYYERGEDVRHLVDGVIKGYGSQEGARPDRAAYVRGVLQATLDNLDAEKDVVAKLNELREQYPVSEYDISFKHGDKGRGYIVITRPKMTLSSVDYSDIVKTIYPEKPMVASNFNVIR